MTPEFVVESEMSSPVVNKLFIKNIELKMRLGCLPEEKEAPQRVDVDVLIEFKSTPEGCLSDELCDTICYTEVISVIVAYSGSRHFNLLESFAYGSYQRLKQMCGDSNLVLVKVHKVNPPVSHHGVGAEYLCGDDIDF